MIGQPVGKACYSAALLVREQTQAGGRRQASRNVHLVLLAMEIYTGLTLCSEITRGLLFPARANNIDAHQYSSIQVPLLLLLPMKFLVCECFYILVNI